ncbi:MULTISPECIES: polysaccharide lyase family 7 protein [Niastella]|uniref:Polysaccharide lyase family 7 protein n=1 Tax=Niastella soli TaxID=2821487 RepID=A0ABS3YLJ1_9BACT|nr:polysaccharide lyase family 7 protein [Niastella soli]MBO9198714.1 polysaccharide lyase family 7 protein [Niastella soli]
MIRKNRLWIALCTIACVTTSGIGNPADNYPASVLDLTNWKLNIPLDENKDGKSDEIKQPQLATYVIDPWFHNNNNNTGVVFRAHCGGTTTSGSGFPRSELREMINNGKSGASWSSDAGAHTMEIEQAITHLPVVKPHIVAGQIHDANDDVIVFRLEGKKLFIDHNGADGAVLTKNYELGTRFKVKMEVSNGEVRSYYNDALVETYPVHFAGAYFKAGAYVQSNCEGRKKVAGESCDSFGEVVIYKVTVTHQ